MLDDDMSGAEARSLAASWTIRDSWLAFELGMSIRTVRRWRVLDDEVPVEMSVMKRAVARYSRRMVERTSGRALVAMVDGESAVLFMPRSNVDLGLVRGVWKTPMPIGWWKAVVSRVKDNVPRASARYISPGGGRDRGLRVPEWPQRVEAALLDEALPMDRIPIGTGVAQLGAVTGSAVWRRQAGVITGQVRAAPR